MKPGNKGKSTEIDENFNMNKKSKGFVSRDIAEAKRKVEEAEAKAAKRKEAKEKKDAEKIEKEIEGGKPDVEGDVGVEDELFNDLLHAYKTAKNGAGEKGRARLVKMMANDSDFKFAMKELLKLASAAKVAKIKTKEVGGSGNVTTFVILKGLHDDVVMTAEKKDSVIDFDQIRDAVNPTSEPKIAYEPEMERPA